MIEDDSGYTVIRGMWYALLWAEKAGGSCECPTLLHASSPRTLGWHILFVFALNSSPYF